MKPILLDTFCKAGGAGMGYHKAGFEVIGVDIEPQPNYPFEFIQADAIEFMYARGHEFDAVHGSPPCQKYSVSTAQFRKAGKIYADLVEETRAALLKTGKPFIIENVPQAPVRPDIVLQGNMFGLPIIRRRHFELSFFMLQYPLTPECRRVGEELCSIFGKSSTERTTKGKFGLKTNREAWAYAMGIDWHMTEAELSEAIPPAYTEFIGKQLFDYLKNSPRSRHKIKNLIQP
jgi:DNA (cytosine-5)-methyltransferase 1